MQAIPIHQVEDDLDKDIGVAMRTVAMLRGETPVAEIPAAVPAPPYPDPVPGPYESKSHIALGNALGWAICLLAGCLIGAVLF